MPPSSFISDTCLAGNSCRHQQCCIIFGFISFNIFHCFGSGSHKTHISFDYIYHLWQFIQVCNPRVLTPTLVILLSLSTVTAVPILSASDTIVLNLCILKCLPYVVTLFPVCKKPVLQSPFLSSQRLPP